MDYTKMKVECGRQGYARSFWDLMRGNNEAEQNLAGGRSPDQFSFALPNSANDDLEEKIGEESVMHQLASVFSQYEASGKILASTSDPVAEFIPDGSALDTQDDAGNFTRILIDKYRLAALLRLPEVFIEDAAFDMERYLIRQLGRAFARAEDRAFISGSGTDEPFGLLHDTEGAEEGASASALSFDALIDLYYSVKAEYRTNGVWLMNDMTALALKKLKDSAGSFLWSGDDDTFMGKPVMITEHMPDAEAGAKPILFGDFSCYWIIRRSPVMIRVLKELFSMKDQIGYIAHEYIDGRLIRREAVKALSITSA